MRSSSILPIANTTNNSAKKSTFPEFGFIKTAYLNNLFIHTSIAYISIFKPEYLVTYFFELEYRSDLLKLIIFYGYFQALPIFLTLQGALQIDSDKAKNFCLLLAVSDLIAIWAIKSLNSGDWPISKILINIIFIFSTITNFVAFCSK